MIKNIVKFLLMALPLVMASCSETPGEPSEFEDWQNRNETYFNNLYQTAKSNPARYKVIRSWDLPENVATNPDNYIVAEVLHEGTSTESPMYTDSVTIHYRGCFIPTRTHWSHFSASLPNFPLEAPAFPPLEPTVLPPKQLSRPQQFSSRDGV